MESRSSSAIRMQALHRYIVWNYLQPCYNNIRVAEFPKSGGTWVGQMLSEIADIPFPRNKHLPFFRKSVQHSHLPGPTKYKTVLVVRDIRDVLTSAYFHFLVEGKGKNQYDIRYWKQIMGDVDVEDVENNMPIFIEKFHAYFTVARQKMTWPSHVESYLASRDKIIIVKYEDLLDDTIKHISLVVEQLNLDCKREIEVVVEEFRFENQAKRQPGQESRSSFLRKGIAGDWKNYFNDSALRLVEGYYGQTLTALGYA